VDRITYTFFFKGGDFMAKAAKKNPAKKASARMKKTTGKKKSSR